MPIDKVTAAQFADEIKTAILDRDASWDVSIGPVPDLTVFPQARVFELMNEDLRQVSRMLTLDDASVFDEPYTSDLEGIVANEGITRGTGSMVYVDLTFYRAAPPTSDLRVQVGFPVGTRPDEGTGASYSFIVIEDEVMPVANAASYFNTETGYYELTVRAVATVPGSDPRVAAERVLRPLRPLAGFDGVTNRQAASGGRDAESNQDLIDRYRLAVRGRQLGTAPGLVRYVLDTFQDVSDAIVVRPGEPEMVRAGEDGGAVDLYVRGEAQAEQTDNLTFIAPGELIRVDNRPLIEVISVTDLVGVTTYVEGTDYEVVFDPGGYSDSVRALDGIRFTAGGAAPSAGTVLAVRYIYDALIVSLQQSLTQPEVDVLGRDLLVKSATLVDIVLSANVRVVSGFDTFQVVETVRAAILSFITGLSLGDPVEASDIQGVVRQISGVDNFVFTLLARASVGSGTSDITLSRFEYANLEDSNLALTLF